MCFLRGVCFCVGHWETLVGKYEAVNSKRFPTVSDKEICEIEIKKGAKPVYCEFTEPNPR